MKDWKCDTIACLQASSMVICLKSEKLDLLGLLASPLNSWALLACCWLFFFAFVVRFMAFGLVWQRHLLLYIVSKDSDRIKDWITKDLCVCVVALVFVMCSSCICCVGTNAQSINHLIE